MTAFGVPVYRQTAGDFDDAINKSARYLLLIAIEREASTAIAVMLIGIIISNYILI